MQAKETFSVINKLTEIMAEHSGQSFDKVKADTQRDYYMTGDEAKEYGLVDKVLTPQALDLSKIGKNSDSE